MTAKKPKASGKKKIQVHRFEKVETKAHSNDRVLPFEIDPKKIEESLNKLKDQVVVWAKRGRYTKVRFKFRGSAWVEIKDGRGKVLLSRNSPGGSEAEVIGKGPFSVVVGNAPAVTMFFNDREFDLEPHTRVAVARFTVP